MTIYLGSDHGGFKMKEELKKMLSGFEVEDMGAYAMEPADDYTEYAFKVATAVSQDKKSLGILLCRSGQGVCIVANKINGVRAGLAWSAETARAGRKDDHINVLCLPSDYINQGEAEQIVRAFLDEEPGQAERYVRRIKKISAIEDHQK